jgi:V/A-type H+/Na+-transporting ATPase subunit A
MPVEEGYPAYLASRLAAVYERAGRVETHGAGSGSVTLIGAVSPPGGDFSEPVTSHTKDIIETFWALSKELADARHYPSIDWVTSFSSHVHTAAQWWHQESTAPGRSAAPRPSPCWPGTPSSRASSTWWARRPSQTTSAGSWRARPWSRRGVLQQSALDPVDTFCSPQKQFALLDLTLMIYDKGAALVELGVPVGELQTLPLLAKVRRCKSMYNSEQVDKIAELPRGHRAGAREDPPRVCQAGGARLR